MISHSDGVFEFTLAPSPALVELVRGHAVDFAERLIDSSEWRSKLEVAVHELLENSVKYAASGTIAFRLEVTQPPRQLARITTRNAATEEHRTWLHSEIQQLSKRDSGEYYRDAMVRAIRTTGHSRLGLSRVAAESSMILACKTLSDGQVEVTAEAWL